MWLDLLNGGIEQGCFRPDIDVDVVYRFIRDTTWVSVRWYQPGGPLTAEEVGRQYLSIVLGGISAQNNSQGDRHGWGIRHRGRTDGRRQAATDRWPKFTPSTWAWRRSAACSTASTSTRRHRRRGGGLPGHHRPAGGQHRAQHLAGRGLSGRGARGYRGPGAARASRRSPLARRRSCPAPRTSSWPGGMREHECHPHLFGDDRRRAVQVHLADQRVGELAAPLRRSGDLPVPRRGDDRRSGTSREEMEVRPRQPREGVRGHPRRAFRERIVPVGSFPHRRGPARSAWEDGRTQALREGGRLTAAMASQISDGASAVLLASEQAVKDHKLTPRARIHHISARGFRSGVHAHRAHPGHPLRARQGRPDDRRYRRRRDQQAFAPVVMAWLQETKADPEKVNPSGGRDRARSSRSGRPAPKLFTTMLNELERTGGRYGLQTMCEGGGTANVTIIERLWVARLWALLRDWAKPCARPHSSMVVQDDSRGCCGRPACRRSPR